MVKKFILDRYSIELSEKEFSHTAPSNIALVKYWGKNFDQTPKNPSLSFSLTNSCTKTLLKAFPKKNFEEKFDFKIIFEGKENEKFRAKIFSFFEKIVDYLPFLTDFSFEIYTENTFPHSSGIASSASSMAALSVCFMKMEQSFFSLMEEDFFWEKASFLARLGSGSACRSLKGSLVLWGKHISFEQSSDLFGIEYPEKVHSVFKNYQDTILLIDKGQKAVSSSQGHHLMNGHPFAQERFLQAHRNITELIEIFREGNLEKFIEIVESEALTLHAMMLCSRPYFILMKPNTLQAIEKIWKFRRETGTPVCFTLDAGANVHVLYPEKYKKDTQKFIISELLPLCENGQCIWDFVS